MICLCSGVFLFGGSVMASQTAEMAQTSPKPVLRVVAPLASFSVKMEIAPTQASSVMATQTVLTIQMRMLPSAVCYCDKWEICIWTF